MKKKDCLYQSYPKGLRYLLVDIILIPYTFCVKNKDIIKTLTR